MALRFIDGFDAYGTTNGNAPIATTRWQTDPTDSVTVEAGRLYGGSGKSIRLAGRTNASLPAEWYSPALGEVETGIIGFGFKADVLTDSTFMFLMEADGAIRGVNLRLTSAGAIAIYLDDDLIDTSSDGIIAIDTWYHIEFKVTVSDSGTYEIHLNGVDVLSGSADTLEFFFGNFSNVGISGISTDDGDGDGHYFDDFFILDDTGGVNDDFVGPKTVFTLFPDGAGSSTDFTPDTGSNFARVNENPLAEASYVQSSTVGHKDLYTYDDLDQVEDIVGVQITSFARVFGGDLQMFHVAKSDATEENSSQMSPFLFGSGPGFPLSSVYENDPDTAAPWDEAGVNAAEFGMKVD